MHPNPIYQKTSYDDALKSACERGFGVLVAQLETPFGAHVPFIKDDDGLSLHLNRSNPLARSATRAAVPVMLIVSLCDAYVSPQWYGMDDQVPTWLYAAVHIHGDLRPLPDQRLESVLIKTSAEFEGRLAPQQAPWTMDKLSEKTKDHLMRAIQPFSLTINKIEATDKFAQNKPAEALNHLAPYVETVSFGANVDLVAARIRHHHGLKSV